MTHAGTLTRVLMLTLGTAALLADSALAQSDPTRYADMVARLQQADAADHVALTKLGTTAGDHALWAVTLHGPRTGEGDPSPDARALFVARQHGDEPAGTEAVLALIDTWARDRDAMPADLVVLAIPMLNPDGAEQSQRRNHDDADLNRDHHALAQSETQALHRVAQRFKPHLVVDAHEFNRTTAEYTQQGWLEFPLVTVGSMNHPYLPLRAARAARRMMTASLDAAKADGFTAHEYLVGDAPHVTHGELRPSTLDADDARNGLSLYGSLGFIIETGIQRDTPDPNADLAQRVAACRVVLETLAQPEALLKAHAAAGFDEPLPDRLPTNYFWTPQFGGPTPTIPVLDRSTGSTLDIPALHLADVLVVKSFVSTPLGYAVPGNDAPAIAAFTTLLDAHGIAYERTAEPQTVQAEHVVITRIEEEPDEVYHRYANRTIARVQPVETMELPAGSIVVTLDALAPIDARRAASRLEPAAMFGLYQWPGFAALIDPQSRVAPVRRLVRPVVPPTPDLSPASAPAQP